MAGLSFLPLGSIAGKSVTSGAGLSSLIGATNPLSAGLSVLSALGGLGGQKVNISQAAAQSGLGIFEPENEIKRNKRLVDFSNPASVAIVAACVVVSIYVYKKHLR